MARVAWRFQADINQGDEDPYVTVFGGDVFTNTTTNETVVHKDTNNPAIVRLSELSAFIVNPTFPEPQAQPGPVITPVTDEPKTKGRK